MNDRQDKNGQAAAAIQREEAHARRVRGAKRLGRFCIRLLCAALAAMSVLLLLIFPAIRLSGEGTEAFLADAAYQVADSLEFTRDTLLHSEAFDREAIEAAGVDLSEKNVVPLLDSVGSMALRFTDGDLSGAELLQAALLIRQLLPVADNLFSTEATFGLFKDLGIKDSYATCKVGYESYHKIGSGALIGYMALIGVIVLCAVGSILLSLFGKRRVFDALLLITEILLLALFGSAVYFGTPLLVQLGMPSALKLSLDLTPALSVLAVILVIVLKRFLRSKGK